MEKNLYVFGLNPFAYLSKSWANPMSDIIRLSKYPSYYLSFTSNFNKLSKYIDFSKFEGIIDVSEYFEVESWKKAYKILKKKVKAAGITRVFGHLPFAANFTYGLEENLEKLYQATLNDDNYATKMFMVKNLNRRMLIFYYLVKAMKLPFYHFISDPIELDMTKFGEGKRFFFYDSERLNTKYFPYIEYAWIYLKRGMPLIKPKVYDFVYGMTSVMTSVDYRHQLAGRFLDIHRDMLENGFSAKYFLKDKIRKINTYVQGRDYNDKYLSAAKYTIIVPSYDIREFSYARLIEALQRKVVPLIHEDCRWQHIEHHLPEISGHINHWLVTPENFIIPKMKSYKYEHIIEALYNCKDFQKFFIKKFYGGYREKYLSVFE